MTQQVVAVLPLAQATVVISSSLKPEKFLKISASAVAGPEKYRQRIAHPKFHTCAHEKFDCETK